MVIASDENKYFGRTLVAGVRPKYLFNEMARLLVYLFLITLYARVNIFK